jgi:hypothetical protein
MLVVYQKNEDKVCLFVLRVLDDSIIFLDDRPPVEDIFNLSGVLETGRGPKMGTGHLWRDCQRILRYGQFKKN